MAAHLSDARNIALMAATLTAMGYTVTDDRLGGTQTMASALTTLETEIASAEATPYETDQEVFMHVFDTGGYGHGPYSGVLAAKMARAVALGG